MANTLYDLARNFFSGLGFDTLQSGAPTAIPTTQPPSASAGALTGNSNTPLLLATPVQVGAAGNRRIYSYNIFNPNTSVVFILLFNKSTAPVLGTDTPIDWLAVPAGAVLDGYWPLSPAFTAGLWIAAVTAANGTTAPATGVPVSLGFM